MKSPTFSPLGFFFLWAICLCGILWGIDFNGLYGQDSYEYFRFTKELKGYWMGGDSFSDCHFPIFYPIVGALFSFIFPIEKSLQYASIFAYILSLYLFYKLLIIRGASSYPAFFYTFFLLGLSAYFIRLGVCAMSDSWAIMSIVGMLFFLSLGEKRQQPYFLIVACYVGAMAIATRYACALVVLPIGIYSIWIYRHRARGYHYFFSILGCLLIFLPIIYLKLSFFSEIVHHQGVADWSFAHFFQRDFDIKGEGIQHYSFPNIVFGTMHYFHPCFLLPAVVLLFFVQKRDFEGNVLFYWVLPAGIYAIFLMGYPHQNTRHQTLILPFIAYILYPAFTRIWAKGEGRGLAGAMVLLVQIGLIYLAIRPLYIYQQHEKGIASLIKQTSPPVQAVYTLGMEGALSAYMDVPVVSLFHTEIDSVVYPFCLVVPDNFMEVWKGRLPLQNFTRIEAMADWDTMPLPTPKWRAWTSQKKKADLYLREKLQ